jgi:hypothetical protein
MIKLAAVALVAAAVAVALGGASGIRADFLRIRDTVAARTAAQTDRLAGEARQAATAKPSAVACTKDERTDDVSDDRAQGREDGQGSGGDDHDPKGDDEGTPEDESGADDGEGSDGAGNEP